MEKYKLIGEITAIAAIISTQTEHQVFVSYGAHINSLNVELYVDGWKKGSKADADDLIFLNPTEYRSEVEIMEQLQALKNRLTEIAQTGDVDLSVLPFTIEIVELKRYSLSGVT